MKMVLHLIQEFNHWHPHPDLRLYRSLDMGGPTGLVRYARNDAGGLSSRVPMQSGRGDLVAEGTLSRSAQTAGLLHPTPSDSQ